MLDVNMDSHVFNTGMSPRNGAASINDAYR
jgi:hypothetical protein